MQDRRVIGGEVLFSGNRLGFWGGTLAVAVMLVLVELTYREFSLTRHVLGQNSPEGATAGWWWSLSVLWLLSAMHHQHAVTNRGGWGGLGRPGIRVYLVAGFSVLSGLEIVQQGSPAALGFLVGSGAAAASYMLMDLVSILTRAVRVPASAPKFESSEQLSLPFA